MLPAHALDFLSSNAYTRYRGHKLRKATLGNLSKVNAQLFKLHRL